MTTRVDVEEIEVTRGERLLAWVLAVFLLIGGLWGYYELNLSDDRVELRDAVERLAPAERQVLRRDDLAGQRASEARAVARERRATATDRREQYRTSLDEGRPDRALRERHLRAQARYEAALRQSRRADAAARRASVAAAPIERKVARIERTERRRSENEQRRWDLITAALRLALVLTLLGASLLLMTRQRRRRSRWAIAGYAAVGASAALALWMGLDYLSDLFDPADLGPIVLSLLGAGFTLIAIAALQRHLGRQLPKRRVKRAQCPFCGFPAGHGAHCEGCGRPVVAPCAHCTAPRRVGTVHCAACGQV